MPESTSFSTSGMSQQQATTTTAVDNRSFKQRKTYCK